MIDDEDDKALVFIWVLLSDTLWCSHVFLISSQMYFPSLLIMSMLIMEIKMIMTMMMLTVEFSSSIYQIITLTKSKSKSIIFHRIMIDFPSAPSHLHSTRL